jgi:glyoxylase-like metal-dependent hydrolase (beta-lactamase superfamily II)
MQVLTVPTGYIQANCYIVFDEAQNAVVIDPGDECSKIMAKITENRLNVGKIILTHGHFDHIGAAADLAKFTHAPVLAGEGEKAVIESNSRVKIPVIDEYLKDGDMVMCGNLSFKVIHTPGHSAGGICLYAKERRCLFSGDTLFKRYIGRCDLFTGNLKQITVSVLNKLFTLPEDTVVYPGHDAKTTIGEEKKSNEVLSLL